MLHELDDLVLGLNDLHQLTWLIGVEEVFLLLVVLLQFVLEVVLNWLPRHIHVYARAEDVNATEAVLIDIKDHVLEEHGLTSA